jgi:hypothetical protein
VDSRKPPAVERAAEDDHLYRQPDEAPAGSAKGLKGADSGASTNCLDTADEAVIRHVQQPTRTIKRESAKSMLMTMQSSGPKGPQTMKMRYTHLGACREGQGTVTLDPNSEQCKKMKARAAKDPEAAARLKGMCG